MENKLSCSRAALGYRGGGGFKWSWSREFFFGGWGGECIGMRFVAIVTSKSHGIASLPRSAGEQQAQTVMGGEDAFLPSMVAFPEQTCAAVSPF